MTKPKQPRTLRHGDGYVTVRGDGRAQARWWDGDTWRAKTFRALTTPDAIELAEDHVRIQARRHRRGYVAPEDRTVADVVTGWLERGKHRWSPNTANTYRARADRYVIPVLGSINASDLTTPRIQHWIDGLVDSGLAPAMVASIVHVLRASFLEAQRIGIVEKAPLAGVQLPARRRGKLSVWSEAETQRVLAVIDGPLWAALYRLALTTGMRPGELRALRWSDIDRERATVTIRRTMSRDIDGAIIVGESTKTGRERTISLPAGTVAALSKWRTEQLAIRLRHGDWDAGDYVFTQPDGGPLAQVTWQREHVRIIAAAGVSQLHIHGLRHTAATILMRRGVNPKIVSEMLGHSSIQTTLDQYSHVDLPMMQVAADALERSISG